MRPTRWAATAVVLGLLAACGDTTPTATTGATRAPGPTPPATSPATPTPTAPPTTTASGSQGGGARTGGGTKGTTRTPTPTVRKTKAQLGIKHGACRWMPNIFVDIGGHNGSSGGVEIDVYVTSLQLSRASDVTVRATGDNGEYAQGGAPLRFGDGTGHYVKLAVKPTVTGAHTMVLTVTVDPDHVFDQAGFTGDDTLHLSVVVPAPRPQEPSNVECF